MSPDVGLGRVCRLGALLPSPARSRYALATEAQTGRMPVSLTFSEAGTIPTVGGTSLQCLLCLEPAKIGDRGAAGDGDPCPTTGTARPLANLTVVITSGSGGTGYLAVQMAKALGASKVQGRRHHLGPHLPHSSACTTPHAACGVLSLVAMQIDC